jgi:hypothetical protein
MSRNTVILGKAGTNDVYIPFSLDNDGVVYTQNAPNSNAGIIQGFDQTLGGVDISAVVGVNTNELMTSDEQTHTLLNNFQFNNTGELLVDIGKNIEITGINVTFPTSITATIDNPFLTTHIQGSDGTNYLPIKIDSFGNISVVSDTLATEATLGNIDTNISEINNKISGILTVNNNNDLQVINSNILDTPLISGFNLESTQEDIKAKLDNLTFFDNGGVLELSVFDSQSYLKLTEINTGISNLPNYTYDVSVVNTEPITITGFQFPTSITVSNFPLTQAVSGTVQISNTSFEVSNFPNSITVGNFPVSITVGNFPVSITVGNFPITQTVSGTVEISNSGITVLNFPTIQPVSGTVIVGNMPGTQPVSGTVAVSNFPNIQQVAGGITVNNFPINYSTETKQDTQIEELEKVVNKKGDIEANIFYNQGASVWADSVPTPGIYELDPNGWAYENTSAGNSMNLYYFNGANETKTLNQVVGQYAVVSNLSTKLNNSLIFGIYTKGSPFFTTRITHSPIVGVNLTAGGKFLIYWGEVPTDIYPTLPRLNFTDIITTGPAVPTEEVLSVSLNTNSSEPAGDVLIFVESLGVVFNNGSVNQSRVLNLLSNRTFYTLSNSTTEFTQNINTYLSQLNKTDGALDTYIKNDTPISVSFDSGITVNNFPAVQQVAFDSGITVNNFPAIQQVAFDSGITVNNFPTVQPVSFDSGITVLNFPAVQPVSFDSGITVLNTSFEISNFPAVQTVDFDTGITVLNFPAVQAVSFDSGITVLNTSFEISNFPAVQPISFDSGITVNNFPAVQAVSFVSGITVLNSSIDSHCYGSSDGTNWHHLKTTATGNLITESKTHDGSNNPISSTVKETIRGLNTASDIYGYFGTNRIAVAVDSSGRVLTKSNVASGTGSEITSTDTTATIQSLDTASSLYTTNGSTRSALSSTAGSLNTNITNQISGFALESTLTTTNGKLDTGNGYLNTINNATGDFTTTTAFGNFISNETLTGGSDSTTETFTRGSYKRNVIAIYRDGSTANTDSISFYTVATSGSPTNLLLATVYPITVGGFRQITINLNLLPFNSLFIKNDSASTINNVYLTVLNG